MTILHRARATLRIMGDDLEPAEVSRLLGVEPSLAYRKGELALVTKRRRPAKLGMWQFQCPPMKPSDFDAQVAMLLSPLTQDMKIWKRLGMKYRVDLFCGWFMREENEGEEISPGTLVALGSRHIRLSLDIYSP
ncbi:MAG: DUF4279 domain-containing protein [Pseudomonadota bacterium]